MNKNTYCNIYKRKMLFTLALVSALLSGLFLYTIHLNYLNSSIGYSLFISLFSMFAILFLYHILTKASSDSVTNEDLASLVAAGESTDPNLTLTVQSLVKVNGAVYKSDLRSILSRLIVLDKNAHRDYAIQAPKSTSISNYKSQYDSSIIAVKKVLPIN